jgi:hypothetical protein
MQSRFSRLTQSHGPGLLTPIADWAIYASILFVGAFQFTHYTRFADFLIDATYPDLARSILEHGTYQISSLPQTLLPPGLPIILAIIGHWTGFTPRPLFSVIAVSTTLGLVITYQLLRRVESRAMAAAACLLFATSPSLFSFNTAGVFPEMPYFLFSVLALLLTLKIDHARDERRTIGWQLVLGAAIILSVLIRSVGIALIMGLCAWCAASLLLSSDVGWRRIRRFSIPLALGLAAQLGWSAWALHHRTLEWQLPGYPGSYFSQLEVKNGQQPELGLAHLSDIPIRVAKNIVTLTDAFGHVLTHRYISEFWSSPAICGVFMLTAIGLAGSLQNAGQLHDWYFLWYQVVLLVWPWEVRDRFLFPVVPLACLYLWRGAKVVLKYSIREPRLAGLGLAAVGLVLSFSSAAFALRIITFTVNMQRAMADRLQPVAATVFWFTLTLIGVGMLIHPALRSSRIGPRVLAHLHSEIPLPLRLALILGVALLVGSGARQVVVLGRENLHPEVAQQDTYPEIEASAWIRTHEPADRVIMAREPEFVFHYTQRRVVWFPPISDPRVLMDGIRRHRVGVVVVAHHSSSYWLPPEDACFQSLLQAYGSCFRLSHQGTDYRVYEVVAPEGGV